MAGIKDRVQGFLESWPKIKEQLEEVLREDEGLFHGDRACRSLPGKSEDDLPEIVGEGNPGL